MISICFLEVGGSLELEDLMGMFSSFLSSMSCTNRSWKGEIRFSRKSHRKDIVICTTNDHIFHEVVPKILEFTRSTYFFSWKLWPSSCLYVKKLWWRIYSAVLKVFTLKKPWFSFIISWIKSKCLVNFSTFFTNTCWWYSIFYVRFFIVHLSSSQNNNKNV